MKIYKDRDMCTGCSACANICPKSCITMKANERGFLEPVVDESQCIKCGLCQKHCHTYTTDRVEDSVEVYSYIHPVENELLASSSGGAFYAIASFIIKNGGYVCAAVFDSNCTVKHILSNRMDDLARMQGSKYVQSEMGTCFLEIKEILDHNQKVLFVGTPCQVLGLKFFLKKDYDFLYLVDIICHSVPSPLVFKDYLSILESDIGKIQKVNFRDKTNGWMEYGLRITGDKESLLLPHKGNLYMEGFLDGLYHRPSCNACPVKTRTGYCSDITLGDFWGYADIHPHADVKNGVSAICVHTAKGKNLLSHMFVALEAADALLTKNRRYHECATVSAKSDAFWTIYKKHGLKRAYRVVYRTHFIIRLKTFVKKILLHSKRSA